MQLSRGIFIAFEGIDGCGKSSLVSKIASYFKQTTLSFISTKEPGGSELGKIIRTLLHDQPVKITHKAEYLLFAADRAQHFIEIIKPALAANMLVLCDRFADSSLVYQGYGRSLNLEAIQNINAWTIENYKPDLTIYIHVDIDTALARIQKRAQKLTSFEQESRSFYEKLILGYSTLYKHRKDVMILDGTENQEKITQEAIAKIMSLLQN